MLARLFGQINASTTFFVVLLVVLATAGAFWAMPNVPLRLQSAYGETQMPLWSGIAIWAACIAGVALGWQHLVEFRFKLLERNAYLPVFITLILSIFSLVGGLHLLILSVLFTFIFAQWLLIFQGERLFPRALNTGLLVGFAALIDHDMAVLLPASFGVHIVFGRIQWRTALIMFIGFVTVWADALMIEYIAFDTTKTYHHFLALFQADVLHENYGWGHLALLSFLFAFGMVEYAKALSRANVFERQSYSALLIVSAMVLALLFLLGIKSFAVAILVPIACLFFVNYLQFLKKTWQREMFIWLPIVAYFLFIFGVL